MIVYCLHSIGNKSKTKGQISVSRFRLFLRIIKFKGLKVINSTEEIDNHQSSQTVMITFDDGYKDNFVYAEELLKQYKLNALVFISTKYLNSKMSLNGVNLETVSGEFINKYQTNNTNPILRIGCHTHGHVELDKISKVDLIEDIDQFYKECGRFKISCENLIAYPKGRFNEIHSDFLKNKFRYGFQGTITKSNLRIGRIELDGKESIILFLIKIITPNLYVKSKTFINNISGIQSK